LNPSRIDSDLRSRSTPPSPDVPLSTIDWNLKSGFDIPIEERHESEVLGAWGVLQSPESNLRDRSRITRHALRAYVRVANPTSEALNPGFDVTPAELITGIITPVGILKPHELWARRRELGYAIGNKDLRAH
jgi:methylthioribose-1-phosphate isomerase